uniref:Uncharacterized protein n=1 Tax=Tanacetum cinerariifolium TaxID=118510 RepID=A0A6L2L511_TANCI|nr:hypothetical protein [Tanacetum cinerariifolium]
MDDVSKHERMIANMDADVDVTLKDVAKDAQDDEFNESTDIHGRQAESQAQIYQIDLEHANKVATITDVASQLTTATAPTLTIAPSATRRRKGVVIRDPEETTTPSIIIHSKAKCEDKGKEILDEVIDHVHRKQKEDNDVKKYQALKRKPQTEAQARKNMMSYLRNVIGFKMDYFKGMSYDDKASKKKKLDEEVEEPIRYLQIVPNDEDDVYTEATPLALKVPVLDYEIYTENNKPYYKIKRANAKYASSNLEKSKKCLWSSEGQDLEAIRVLWCADYHIYYNTVGFAGREEISTYKVHSGSNAQ